MAVAGFWDDQESAQVVIQKLKSAKGIVNSLDSVSSEAEDLGELAEMIEGDAEQETQLVADLAGLQERYNKLELQTLFSGPYDNAPAMLTIQAGAGGTDASDFASMLMRMYSRWGEAHGMDVSITDINNAEEAGIKNATLLIKGENAYGKLRCEIGVHRLVRISPFNANGKRQTSFVAVDVLPEVPDNSGVEINEKDLKVDTFRAGGKGGQHVNTTDSAVRITHLPTGVVVSCQNQRSQHKNRAQAMKVLKARLIRLKEMERESELAKMYSDKGEIGFGSQIRSYTLQPYSLVKDHRPTPGIENHNVQAVLDGDIDGFIEGYLKWKLSQESKS